MSPKLTEVATIVDILRLKQQGLSKNAIAKRLGISRDTVRKYWNCVQLETGGYGPRPKLIDPYEEYITRRLDEYPELSADQLYDEIKEMGFEGSERTVRRHVAAIRPHKQREYKREIVFDNAKVVVSERVGKSVRFNENLLHFALACGFTPKACWTYDA